MKSCPHLVGDNAQTHFDNVRLVKGEPPGRAQCNYYTNLLSTAKVSKEWRKSCTENHMKNVAKGDFTWHSGDFGDAGAPSGGKFYDKERVNSIVDKIQLR